MGLVIRYQLELSSFIKCLFEIYLQNILNKYINSSHLYIKLLYRMLWHEQFKFPPVLRLSIM